MLRLVCVVGLFLFAGTACKTSSKSSDLSGTIAYDPNDPQPAKIMYHYGNYSELRKDGLDDAFTPNLWGIITKAFPNHRKGLYVATHPAYNERYVKYLNQVASDGSDAPWLMGVAIKSECLAPERSLSKIWRLHEDPRYRAWNASAAAQFERSCAMPQPISKQNFEAFNERFGENHYCGNLVYDFMQAHSIKVVQDALWPHESYWIVLDPNCIEDMQADPPEVLSMMAIQEYWNMAPFTTNWNRHQCNNSAMTFCRTRKPAVHSFYILLRSLYESAQWDPEVLRKIRAEAEKSDIVYEVHGKQIGLKEILTTVVDKAIECQAQGDVSSLKEQIGYYLQKGHSKMKEDVYIHNYNFYAYGIPKVTCGSAKQVQVIAPQPPPKAYWYQLEFERPERDLSATLIKLSVSVLQLGNSNVRCWMDRYYNYIAYCRTYNRAGYDHIYKEFYETSSAKRLTAVNKPAWLDE